MFFSKSSRLGPDFANWRPDELYAPRAKASPSTTFALSVDLFTHHDCLSAVKVGGRITSPSSHPGFHRVEPGAFVRRSFAGVASGVASCWQVLVAFSGSVS